MYRVTITGVPLSYNMSVICLERTFETEQGAITYANSRLCAGFSITLERI